MITPPPVQVPKKRTWWIVGAVILAVVASVCFMPAMIIWGMFRTPAIAEGDYLQEVQEVPATLKELGFTGSVIATRGNTLTLYTADGETPFYSAPKGWRIFNLAGPNRARKLVVFEINQTTNGYRFNVIDFGSGETRIAHQGSGNVIWDSLVGEMQMHPVADKVLYFTGTGNRQYPGAYMNIGKLVELDLGTKVKRDLASDVVENEFTYSPDGTVLYYAGSTKEDDPQIFAKIIATGDAAQLRAGWECSLSYDGTSLIVYGRNGTLLGSLDLKTKEWVDLESEEFYFWPIKRLTESLYLGQSLPLTKEAAEYFPPTGSISGAQLKTRLGVFEPFTRRAAILRNDLSRHDPLISTPIRLSADKFETLATDESTE